MTEAQLEPALRALLGDGPLPWDALRPLLTARLEGGAAPEEVALVAAALLQAPTAVARLDALLATEAQRQAHARSVDPAELAQQVRTKLLGPEGRLATWDGRGPLGAWVRVVTTRVALNLRRDQGPEIPTSSPADQVASAADPELALLRRQYGAHFKAAFVTGLSALEPKERTLLRLSLVEGVTLQRLGVMYRRDASTLSRWLDRARQTLAQATQRALKERLKATDTELDSLMRGVELELSTSLSVWLRDSRVE